MLIQGTRQLRQGDGSYVSQAAKALGLCTDEELGYQFMMYDRGINSVKSTSAGRLFDAVSAVLGIRRVSTFEGEASTTLQFVAERYSEDPYPEGYDGGQNSGYEMVTEDEDGGLVLRTDLLFMDLAQSMLDHSAASTVSDDVRERLAWEFHRRLADGIIAMCCVIRERMGLDTAALSGGVFQNRLLLRMCEDGLIKEGFEVLEHSMVPPNDGGICLGQAAVAAQKLCRIKNGEEEKCV